MKLKKFINGFTADFSTKHRIKFYAEWNGSPLVHLFIWDKNVRSLKPYDKYYLINHFNNINETLEFLKQKSKIMLKQEVVLKLLKLEKEILDNKSGVVNVSKDALININ
jgi:hypothetical protein